MSDGHNTKYHDLVTVLELDSARAFLQELQPSCSRWDCDPLVPKWLFRGQATADRPKATIYRDVLTNDPRPALRERVLKCNPDLMDGFTEKECGPFDFGRSRLREQFKFLTPREQAERGRDLVLLSMIEVSLLRRFSEVAERAGHRVQRPSWTLEAHVGNDQDPSVVYWCQGRVEYFESPLSAAARHHGIPSRLVDWTTHPLIAAYFACIGAAEPGSAPTVWALNRDWVRLGSRFLREYQPSRQILPNLALQEGRFLWQHRAHEWFGLRGHWPDIVETVAEFRESIRQRLRPTGTPFFRITMPQACRQDMLRLLWTHRVSMSTLMSNLDHVTTTVLELLSLDKESAKQCLPGQPPRPDSASLPLERADSSVGG